MDIGVLYVSDCKAAFVKVVDQEDSLDNILTFQKFYQKEPIPEWFVCVENGHAIPISRQDAE